jgi:uncharacterized Ntn-hydrolase superfamily protein
MFFGMTYSIIGYDSSSGKMGVALQSYYYGCAPRTLVAEPGVGIVAMQMVPEAGYGKTGIEEMQGGARPREIIDRLVARDESRAIRQVAMMRFDGDAGAFTGKGCIPSSGHAIGATFSAQGAMVESENVWLAMAETFQATSGDLPGRLLAAMRAGENEGGDIRGRRAAALIVVSASRSASWVLSRPVNIRVDDNTDPLSEIERHLVLQQRMGEIELAFERALAGDVSGAIDDYRRIDAANPDDPDITMRFAIVLAMAGEIAAARKQLERMVRVHAGWSKVPDRLVAAGLLPNDPDLLEGLRPAADSPRDGISGPSR